MAVPQVMESERPKARRLKSGLVYLFLCLSVIRLAERIAQAGLESPSESHAKHLEGKLWESRLTGRDGIARALYVTAVGRRWW